MQGLPPRIPDDAEVIILGSFPSAASLTAGQYYAHPRNAFWHIMSDILHEPLRDLPYEARWQVLARHKIGVWDAIGTCERHGSLDSAITNAQPNDFSRYAHIQRVLFNGTTAWKYRGLVPIHYQVLLPSTSPARTMPYAEKLAAWRNALRKL
jgi:hypoxanthine-DNA glycosylase